MSSLWLDIKAAPGADIDDCCEEAVRIAIILGITVWFDFNGIRCAAKPTTNPDKLRDSFREQLENSMGSKIATA